MGRTYIDSKGYVRFKGSRKLVHRWVMEKKIGRELKKTEVVHHIDKDKLNNEEDNLKLYSNNKEHLRIEHPEQYERKYNRKNKRNIALDEEERKIFISIGNQLEKLCDILKQIEKKL